MYLLYVDDSGLEIDKKCRHCVLAGFAIREDKTYWVQQAIDNIVEKHLGIFDIELHGTDIRGGRSSIRFYHKFFKRPATVGERPWQILLKSRFFWILRCPV